MVNKTTGNRERAEKGTGLEGGAYDKTITEKQTSRIYHSQATTKAKTKGLEGRGRWSKQGECTQSRLRYIAESRGGGKKEKKINSSSKVSSRTQEQKSHPHARQSNIPNSPHLNIIQ